MIIDATNITQPFSGEFQERIYDIESPWNSQNWTFIKFTNDDFSEWCGQFRGSPKSVAVSEKLNSVLVLTSNYLFELDRSTNEVINFEDRPQYQNLTVAPNGNYILIDYYNLFRICNSINEIEMIESPIQMDMVKFKDWNKEKLIFMRGIYKFK